MDSLSIDGTLTYEKRDKIIEKFHEPSSARVLIFSLVGSAGLNLAIADIVIFFVRSCHSSLMSTSLTEFNAGPALERSR